MMCATCSVTPDLPVLLKMIFASLTAVLIDDNEMSRTALQWILRNQGCRVVGEAPNAEAGLRLVSSLQPSIVCLDIMMPGGDGIDILGGIKAQSPDSLVIMVSASSDAATVRKALTGGAVGFIIKPFNPERVVNAIERALQAAKG